MEFHVLKRVRTLGLSCCFADDGMAVLLSACAARIAQFFFLRPIKFLIYGILVAVPSLMLKLPDMDRNHLQI
mgnify:CR=1 FL=1